MGKPLFGEHLRAATDPRKVAERDRIEETLEERAERIDTLRRRVSKAASYGALQDPIVARQRAKLTTLEEGLRRDLARLSGTSRFKGIPLLEQLFQ